jgi:transposase InsO family protein
MKGAHPVEGLCELLQVSRSGYYRWRRARPSRRATQDAALSEHIVRFHARSRRTYGSPRIVQDLQEQKLRISRRRCARLMREHGLQGRKRHRRRPCTTDSRHGHAPAPNQLLQRVKPTGPDQVWVTDITYVPTGEGFLYLAAILDGWSRRVVGWACGPTLHASLALMALRKAIQERRPAPGVLHHSDQGVQYASGEYRQALQEAGLDSAEPIDRRAAESIVFGFAPIPRTRGEQ